MQKLLIFIFIAVLIASGGTVWYVENYSYSTYYVQVHADGKIEKDETDNNFLLEIYRYEIKGFNSEGDGKNLNFTANHNLRHEAYLKVLENKKRGVISWKEIKKESVPKKALDNLKKQEN